MNRISALLLCLFFISCTGKHDKTQAQKKTLEPENGRLYHVPEELREISGISFVNDSLLVAIQDEDGMLYFYDLKEEKVVRQYEFWRGKDYEDLCVADKDLYIMNSAGTIYELKNFMQGPSKPAIYKTGLTKENNIEGLAFDRKNNRLLLAVKDIGLDGKKEHKPIYAFDLKSKQLRKQEVYSIRLADVESYFKGDKLEEYSKKILKAVGNQNMNEVFRTSALNFDPVSGNLYVLSSLNKIVAVLDTTGKIIRILELDGKEFIQPEGLAFTSDGRLFISNEGKDKQANIIQVEFEED